MRGVLRALVLLSPGRQSKSGCNPRNKRHVSKALDRLLIIFELSLARVSVVIAAESDTPTLALAKEMTMRQRGNRRSNTTTTMLQEDSYDQPKAVKKTKSALWKPVLLIAAVLSLSLLLSRRPRQRSQSWRTEDPSFIPKTLEDSEFAYRPLAAGEVEPLVWKDSGESTGAHMVGLPTALTQSIHDHCVSLGLLDLFWDLIYTETPQVPGSTVLHTLQEHVWISTTPEADAHWENSNLHWVDVADEATFEYMMRLLAPHMDEILQGVGQQFDSQGLGIGGIGFIVVSHLPAGGMHRDIPKAGKNWFDFLFPLVLPPESTAFLKFGKYRVGAAPFTPNIGYLLAGDTWHGSGRCDFTQEHGLRVAVTIDFIDIQEDNAAFVAADATALFPAPYDTTWLMAQQGRLYNRSNESVTFRQDQGRKAIAVADSDERCSAWATQGICESDLRKRMKCLKSCRVYLEESEYRSPFR